MIYSFLILGILPVGSQALELRMPFNPDFYECKAVIYSSTDKISEDFNFVISKNGGAQRGQAFEFSKSLHKLTVQVDAKWLIMSWYRDSKIVAEGVVLLGPNDPAKRKVGVMFDPNVADNRVSLGCNKL